MNKKLLIAGVLAITLAVLTFAPLKAGAPQYIPGMMESDPVGWFTRGCPGQPPECACICKAGY